ncbi:sensor histidine kinase [Nocardioides sp. Bht2]|uniref:sensor histidine kinase n=1 Tax=Nocardioides sp. Bht2 TaxID=3392297 RepID=UPI0039B5AD31
MSSSTRSVPGNPVAERGGPGWLVALLPLLCIALLPISIWVDLQAPAGGPGVEITGGAGWPWTLNGAVLGLLAAIVLRHDRHQMFGWALAGFGLFWALDGFAQSYVRSGLSETEAWPAMTWMLWFLNRFGVYLTAVTAVLVMIFPTGRFLSGAWGWVSRATVAMLVLSGLVVLIAPAEGRLGVDRLPDGVDLDPTTVPWLSGFGERLVSASVAVGVVAFLVSLLTVAVRYHRSRGVVRDQMRWLLWSVVVILGALVVGLLVPLPASDHLGAFLATVLPPAAMTVAIVRPSLVPIGDLLARTLVLAAVVAVLVVADVAVLWTLTQLLGDGLSRAQVAGVVLAVAVLLYSPARSWLAARVRRRMLGERGQRYDTLAGLSAVLEEAATPHDQLDAAARAVATAFGVGFVSIEVEWPDGDPVVATHGARPQLVRELPIRYRAQEVGRLILPAKGVRSRLGPRDERLLGDLVRQAAAAVRTTQLMAEVQASREQLVAAREEERRRIRRDLHDGLGPALSGIVFQLDAAQLRLRADAAPSGEIADQLGTVSAQMQEVVADVRRLVHGLRPPALDDRGLLGAIRQLGEGLELTLDLAADDLAGRLPAAVEVAVYRIIAEALTNVARHAGTTRAEVSAVITDGVLRLTVVDRGRGLAGAAAGVGMSSIRERADELGGVATVRSGVDGGTEVEARIPVRSE